MCFQDIKAQNKHSHFKMGEPEYERVPPSKAKFQQDTDEIPQLCAKDLRFARLSVERQGG